MGISALAQATLPAAKSRGRHNLQKLIIRAFDDVNGLKGEASVSDGVLARSEQLDAFRRGLTSILPAQSGDESNGLLDTLLTARKHWNANEAIETLDALGEAYAIEPNCAEAQFWTAEFFAQKAGPWGAYVFGKSIQGHGWVETPFLVASLTLLQGQAVLLAPDLKSIYRGAVLPNADVLTSHMSVWSNAIQAQLGAALEALDLSELAPGLSQSSAPQMTFNTSLTDWLLDFLPVYAQVRTSNFRRRLARYFLATRNVCAGVSELLQLGDDRTPDDMERLRVVLGSPLQYYEAPSETDA